MMKVIVPLRIDPISAQFLRADETRVVESALRDRVDPPVQLCTSFLNAVCKFFENVLGGEIEYRVNGVKPKRIDMELGNPVKRVLQKVVTHFIALRVVVVQRSSPWRLVVVGEIRSEFGR